MCRGCRREFDSRGALSTHKRSCSSKITDAVATSLAKRRQNQEVQQAAKIRRQEEEEATLIARQDIRESFAASGLDLPPVCVHSFIKSKSSSCLVQDPGPRSPSPPAYRFSGLPNHRRRLPKRFRDDLPPIPVVAPPSTSDSLSADIPDPPPPVPCQPTLLNTARDHYGLFRQYTNSFPSHNPDNFTSTAHLCDSPTFIKPPDGPGAKPWWSGFGSMQVSPTNRFTPFLNATMFRLMSWFYSGSTTKSLAKLDRLVNEVILADDFNTADLKEFRASKESSRLDNYHGDFEDIRSSFSPSDGWQETSVKIRIPADGVQHASEDAAPMFEVPGLFYRKPLEVIKAAFRESSVEHFHFTPFQVFYQPSDNAPTERSTIHPQ